MTEFVSLYDAKTQLSSLVDRADHGEEIVITKNGVPSARLMPIPQRGEPRKPSGLLAISYIADDFDAPDPAIERMFNGDEA